MKKSMFTVTCHKCNRQFTTATLEITFCPVCHVSFTVFNKNKTGENLTITKKESNKKPAKIVQRKKPRTYKQKLADQRNRERLQTRIIDSIIDIDKQIKFEITPDQFLNDPSNYFKKSILGNDYKNCAIRKAVEKHFRIKFGRYAA